MARKCSAPSTWRNTNNCNRHAACIPNRIQWQRLFISHTAYTESLNVWELYIKWSPCRNFNGERECLIKKTSNMEIWKNEPGVPYPFALQFKRSTHGLRHLLHIRWTLTAIWYVAELPSRAQAGVDWTLPDLVHLSPPMNFLACHGGSYRRPWKWSFVARFLPLIRHRNWEDLP